ncbi:MAG: UDP-N-acetylmuramoyl-L-alanine--D-glutamate ligase [Candidatus Didemnitutus sp.]|nr:UDP-N-acetylmuramoyl-L-alanine--D-glutamate ligase [Candidatus Didemnitutus sp.]
MLPQPPPAIAALLARPVAVFGAGVSGQGVLGLLAALGAKGVLFDEKAVGTEPHFSSDLAQAHGLVVFSPGFAPGHPWLATARSAGCTCLGELDFASLFWRGDLIAVTGTNGKTTLTEFLAHALNAVGRPAAVTGNVGYPLSRLVTEQSGKVEVAVCEVSSFQAETLHSLTPTATLWTNFAEDHLERHAGMEGYFAAKCRLLDRTPPEAIRVGSSVVRYAMLTNRALPPAAAVDSEGQLTDPRLSGSVFAGYPLYENFLLAKAWWHRAGLTEQDLFAAAHTFKLGEHRLARVAEKRRVTFWNDSKATNFHAVEGALGTFDRPVFLILGGKAKGGDLAGFVQRLAPRIRHAFLIGETQPVLATFCRAFHVAATPCQSLEEAVHRALAAAAAGDHVLLSPGFASFDMFHGYDDRGRQFCQIVENL